MHGIANAVRLRVLGMRAGYYPPGREETFNEDGPGGDFDFLSRLCTDWEAAATLPDTLDVRTVKIRTGLASQLLLSSLNYSFLVNDLSL